MELNGLDVKRLEDVHIDEMDIVRYSHMNDLMFEYGLESHEIAYIIKRDYGEPYRSLSGRLLRQWMGRNRGLTMSQMKKILVGRSRHYIRDVGHSLGISFDDNYRKSVAMTKTDGTHPPEIENRIDRYIETKEPDPYLHIEFTGQLNGCHHGEAIGVTKNKRLFIRCNRCGVLLAHVTANMGAKITPFDINRIINEIRERLQGCIQENPVAQTSLPPSVIRCLWCF
jgi:hypothetical protein